jgi:hypothetical protein
MSRVVEPSKSATMSPHVRERYLGQLGYDAVGSLNETRRAASNVNDKLTVVLRKPYGLEPTRFMPDKGADVYKPPIFYKIEPRRQKPLRCPTKQVAVVGRHPNDIEA